MFFTVSGVSGISGDFRDFRGLRRSKTVSLMLYLVLYCFASSEEHILMFHEGFVMIMICELRGTHFIVSLRFYEALRAQRSRF